MGLRLDQKIVIVLRETRLGRLRQKYATVGQAEFVLEVAREREVLRKTGKVERASRRAPEQTAIYDYRREDNAYKNAVDRIRKDLHGILPIQMLDRAMLPNYLFGPEDIIVTVGQDGLVANTAKYVGGRPIVAVNPDPERFDGILLPFRVEQARAIVLRTLENRARSRRVTMGEALLSDGQRLLAFNDFFIGCRTHVSARYRIEFGDRTEPHSSSGVLVSTGAGSTGWLSSIFNMAAGLGALLPSALMVTQIQPIRLNWEDPRLMFVVREPFVSKRSSASIVSGMVNAGQELILESQMPGGGVIFSDGIETDYLEFNSGSIVRIRAAQHGARLIVP
jgi:NAD kinase